MVRTAVRGVRNALSASQATTVRLRFPVGPDALSFLGWRGSLSDAEWVGLGGLEHDADYFARLFLDTGVDLRSR